MAVVLNYLMYWHGRMLRQRPKLDPAGGVPKVQLLQYHTAKQIRRGIAGAYCINYIRYAVRGLERLGYIEVHKNPWRPGDRTRHFYVTPEAFLAVQKTRKELLEGVRL